VGTSFVFSFVVTFVGLALALLLASLANARIRGLARLPLRCFLWPYGIAPAIAGIIWLFRLPSVRNGILPWLLSFVTAYQFQLVFPSRAGWPWRC